MSLKRYIHGTWACIAENHISVFTILGLVAGMAACGKTEPAQEVAGAAEQEEVFQPTFLNVDAQAEYVGSVACFDCHEDIWSGYQQHGMARSYYPLTAENVVETFPSEPVQHAASGFYYRTYQEGEQFFTEEYRLDTSGEKTHRLVRRMDYVVGSGNAARTYLTENNGRLYELPLTWYTQAEKWDFSPGYKQHNSRFDRLIPDRCMACHNGYAKSVPFVEGMYEDVPHGIGCERCHGPGSLHVEDRLATPDVAGAIDYTIVNPDHLLLDRQLDVCQQCHLHTTVSILREGRSAFSFRPSESLADHVALFAADSPSSADQISVISHADRMKQSACFIATAGTDSPMTCVTCHDPHEAFRDQGPAYFNDTCLGCHPPVGFSTTFATEEARRVHTADADCFACHMPRVEAEDAPHATFTDHWIRVVDEAAALPAPVAAHGPAALAPYFERDREGPEAALYEGMAYVVLGRQQGDTLALDKGRVLLKETLAERPDHGEAQFLLGLANAMLGRVEASIPPLEQAVQLNPNVPERLNALAQSYEADQRDPTPIRRLYERALALQPALADVRLNYGRFLEVQGQLVEAIEQYQRTIEDQPWLGTAYYNLGTAYLRNGDVERAETALKQAIQLDPDDAKALGNLGLLYAGHGQEEQALAYFEQAVAVAPDDATALGNLGTYYLNQDNLPQAIALLRRAVDADSAYLNGLLNLSLAYFRNDQMEQARIYAERAQTLDPNNDMARQILTALY